MAIIETPASLLQLSAADLLAAAARLKGQVGKPLAAPPLAGGRIPLSFAQERLWFLDQLAPGTAFYNIPGGTRLAGPLRPAVLAASLGEIARRHESLRTTFADEAGRPYQVVSPPAPVPLPAVDLSALDPARREAELTALANLETRRPFDLASGPLLRTVLFRLGGEDHAVVYTMHHIVSDGWSAVIFLREVAALYAAFAAGRPSPLRPLALQYPQYAVWQRSHLAGEVLAAHLAYWRERLGGIGGLDLPADRSRPPVERFRGSARAIRLPEATASGLKELGRRDGASLFMVLLAAFKALLFRLTGQADLAVGSPIANRNRREVEEVIGFFSNTIVLRTDLAGEPTFRQLLGRVREVTLGAYAHEDLPFERIVAELQPDRDMSRNPLFQVMCVLQNQPRSRLSAGDLVLLPLALSLGSAKFDLTIFWTADGDGLRGMLEHNSDLFDETTARRFDEQHAALCEQAIADPERPISALPLLGAAARHQLLHEWNATAAAASRGPVHAWVEAQAARTPGALAAAFAGERLTYRELNARANRLAHGLRRRGVGPESLVGICVERSLDMAVAALAVLKAGGALVALDPADPRERLATIIEDAGLAVLLTERELEERFPRHAGITLRLERGVEPFPCEPADDPAAGVLPDHPMYVSYTSGSTGQPKGIVVPHRAFANLLAWQLAASPRAGEARTVQFATFGFCVSFQEIFSAWCSGGTLVVASEMERRDIAGLPGFLAAAGWPAIPPVGRPIANVRIHLLDERLAPVPIGVRGELYAAGECVARGYLNDPLLTAQKMIPDPYGGSPGGRLYRTGDLARHLADGRIEYLGRLDGQVKVRGFRVELGEVETVLARHPAVKDAAVVAADAGGGKRLIAYVVAEGDGEPPLDELRLHLRGTLPEHMIPAAFVVLAALPLNANGKLDQTALPKPDAAELAGGRAAYVAPRTPVEEILAGLWAEVLGVERVGARDGFFELGGHSLLVTQLVSRTQAAFGVELAIRRLFEAPTLEALAREVELELARGRGTAAPPLVRVPRDRPLPLSFAQERLWFLDRLEPGRAVYNLPLALVLRGRLDRRALAASLGAVVARHEVLRTTFAENDLGPMQVVAPPAAEAAAPPLVDLAALPAWRLETVAAALGAEEAARPFDLARGPLLRAALVRLAEERHVVLFTMHHVVSDGWSMGVLVREVGAVYSAAVAGRRPALGELPVQYADYAVWQRGWLTAEVVAEQLAFWRAGLAGAPALLELPLDRPRPPLQTMRGAHCVALLGAALAARLAAFDRRRGTTPFMTLLAVFSALLGRLSGQDEVVVGSPIANRTRMETEPLIGFFVNTLALRARLDGEPGLSALAATVRETTLAAYGHQDLPFERLVEELQPERSLAYTPFFQVMFALQNTPMGRLELPGLSLEPLATGGARGAKFDLTVSLTESAGAGAISGTWEYNVDLFDEATVARMARQLEALCDAGLAAPEVPLAALPLLSDLERRQIEAWSAAAGTAAAGAALEERFEAWAAAEPARPALCWEGESISYGELEARANRLAHRLRELGVGPEVLVGVCLERSPAMVVALLAVLKAEGAYLPLDPAYPRRRLEQVLADSAAPIVLTGESSPALSAAGRRSIRLDLEGGEIARQSAAAPARLGDPRQLAYVLYTSGSTGRPKGVAVEHRSAIAMLGWATSEWGDALGGVLAGTSIAFDISVFELFAPLSCGGTVILAENALALPRLAAAGEVTLLNTVPSAMAELLQGPLPASIRVVNLAGEALPRGLVEAVHALPGVERVYNLYGPTEDTTYSTFSAVAAGGTAAPAVGRPIAGSRIHLVDRRLRPVPLGAAGEALITGAGLARGYLGRPDLTAERFIPDPFAGPSTAGARLYRTGDLLRWRNDGELAFLARLDQQVKIRGFRVEPGEAEAVLAAHPAVAAAAVVVRAARAGGRELLACVVPRDAAAPASAGDLRAHLAARLPDYLVPAAFATLPALPLTASGKVDRRALAAGSAAGTTPEACVRIAPRDACEAALAAIWEDLLGIPAVGVRESFFDLGGHSLLAVRLMTRIERQLGRELPLATLFRAPTIEALAARLRDGAPLAASPLVRLGAETAGDAGRAPLFLVHPIGGAVFCYRELARHLAAPALGGRPVYALAARGLGSGEAPRSTVAEMAADYLASLAEVQTAGPYLLGGWSFGSLVALEMARQLEARGETVALLALIDPMTITAEERARELDDVAMLALLMRDLGGLAGAPVAVPREELAGLSPAARLDVLLARAVAAGVLPPDADLPQVRRIVALYQANQRAAMAYAPAPWSGAIQLFQAAGGPLAARLALWEAIARGGLVVHTLPGDHYSLLREPTVSELAAALGRLAGSS